MKKKKKSGSIAIPFLLTFLISLIIIGGIAMVIYDKIDTDNSSLITMTNEGGSLSDSNSHTIMLVLDLSDTVSSSSFDTSDDEYDSDSDDDTLNDEDSDNTETTYDWEEPDEDEETFKTAPYTFVIMRSIPIHKQLVFIGLPENMHAGTRNESLTKIFQTGGGNELKSAVSYSLEIPIDRYMVFKSKSFRKICNILGGVNYAVPGNIPGFKKSSGLQYLSPDQIEKIVSYGSYGGGEIQRAATAASIIASMVNQTSGARIADNLDNTFETMVNANDTDISALDYQEQKYAIKFLMKHSDPTDEETVSDRAIFMTPSGTQTSDAFIIDTSFLGELTKYFIVQATDNNTDTTLQPMIPETGGQ